MPLVTKIPPPEYYGKIRNAEPFHGYILQCWDRRCKRTGDTFWLYRGRLVSQSAINAFGVEEAWQLAELPTIEIDTTVTPMTLGPA